jgi:hypothetical protein
MFTPELNGQIDDSFVSLWGHLREMLKISGLGKELRNKCGQSM